MDPTQLPFMRTRNRGYAAQLDYSTGGENRVSSSVTSALLSQHDGHTDAALCMQASWQTIKLSSSNQPPEQAATTADASVLKSALCEIAALQTKLSGLETAVSQISNSHSLADGRHGPSHGRRAHVGPHATTACTSKTSANQVRPTGAIAALNLSTHQLPVSSGKLMGCKPGSPYSAPAQAAAGAGVSQHASSAGSAGPKPAHMHPTAAWLVSAAPAASASAEQQSRRMANPNASDTSNINGANGMAEVDLHAEIKDPLGHLLRKPVQHLAVASTAVAEAAPKYSSHSSGDIPENTAVVPVTRDEAVQLERKLAQALPPGAMLLSQQQHLVNWHKQQQQQWQQQLAVHPALLHQYQEIAFSQTKMQQLQLEWHKHLPTCDVLCPELTQKHQVVDKLLREAAQQVACHCSEQGRAIDGLRERCAELANSLYIVISSLVQQSAALSSVLAAAAASTAADKVDIHKLQCQLQDISAEKAELQSALSVCQEKLEQLGVESTEDNRQAQLQISLLRQQLWQSRENLELQQAAAEKAALAASNALHAQEAAAQEAQQELLQRLGFLNLQLMALREQQQATPDTTDASAQTDAEPAPPACTPKEQSQHSFSSISSESSEEEDYKQPHKRRKKALDLLQYAKRGQQRSKLWVVKVIGQLYADKAVADTIADRAGQQRSSMPEFIFTWHLNRYGLKHLASEALSDLLASACHHAKTNRVALWFGRFCGLAAAIIQPELGYHSSEMQGSHSSRWQSPASDSNAGELTLGQPQGSTSISPAVEAGDEQQTLSQQQTAGAGSSSPGEHNMAALPAAVPLQCQAMPVTMPAATIDTELLLSIPAALDFYLFCCCQLAYPNSVIALFSEGEDAAPLVRSSLVMESLKAIFRYLQDPEGRTVFVARHLDAAAVPASSAACSSGLGTTAGTADSSVPASAGSTAASASMAAAHPVEIAAKHGRNPRPTVVTAEIAVQSSNSGLQIAQQEQQQQPLLMHFRAPAASGSDATAGAARCREGSLNNSSGGSSNSSASGIHGGFGHYSAWVLLDLLMAEWLDRVLANGQSMVQLRKTIANMHPPLPQQVAAAAAEQRPGLLVKLHEAKAALDAQLSATAASGQAAAAAVHTLDKSAGFDGSDYLNVEQAAGADASTNRYQLPLSQHWLIADAVSADAAGAWKAYHLLTEQLRVVHMRVPRPAGPLVAAEAISAQEHEMKSQPITAEAVSSHLGQALQQGITLSEALQQHLQALGLDVAATSRADCTDAVSGAGSSQAPGLHTFSAGSVSSAVIQDVLLPGGMATALQLAKQRRAAANAAATGSSG